MLTIYPRGAIHSITGAGAVAGCAGGGSAAARLACVRGAAGGAAPASRVESSRTAPVLDSGSLPLPHFGDWMQEGQPASQPQDSMARAVACSHSLAVWKPRSAKPAPPWCPS